MDGIFMFWAIHANRLTMRNRRSFIEKTDVLEPYPFMGTPYSYIPTYCSRYNVKGKPKQRLTIKLMLRDDPVC